VTDHIVDANKMVELSRALTRAGVDTPVFRAIDGYWYDDDDGRNEVTIERVERELCYAAILWLMGRAKEQGVVLSLSNHSLVGGDYQIEFGHMWEVMGDTLIDALLAAVTREVGDD